MFDDIGELEGAILQRADRPSRMHREAHQTAERKARRHDHAATQIALAVARDCGVDGQAERAITVRRGALDQCFCQSAVAKEIKLEIPVRSGGRDRLDRRDRKSTRSELQSLMRISYAVFCLKKKKTQT